MDLSTIKDIRICQSEINIIKITADIVIYKNPGLVSESMILNFPLLYYCHFRCYIIISPNTTGLFDTIL